MSQRSDGQEYAMKRVKIAELETKDQTNTLSEVRLLASVHHPHVLAFRETFVDHGSGEFCLVTDFAEGGDLLGLIKHHANMGVPIKESFIWSIVHQLSEALLHLHNLGVIHRDVKAANVLLNKDKTLVTLADLNVAKVATNRFLHTQTGTPYYVAPEVWRDEPYDSKTDLWSLGCLAYELCNLSPPFRAKDMEGLFEKVQA